MNHPIVQSFLLNRAFHLFRLLVLYWALLIGAVRAGIAEDFYWHPQTSGSVWDLTTPGWERAAGGDLTTWTNTGDAAAIFLAGPQGIEVTLGAGESLLLKTLEVKEGNVRLIGSVPALDRLDFGSSAAALTVQSAATLTVDAAMQGTGGLTKSGEGKAILNLEVPQGLYAITGGELELGEGVRANGALSIGGGAGLAASLLLADSAAFDLAGNLTFSNVGTPQAALISGGTINLNGNRSLVVQNIAAAVDLTIESAFADGTEPSTLTKTGGGTVVLSGANRYTGGTVLAASSGIVRIEGNEASIAASSSISIGAAATLSVGAASDSVAVDRIGDEAAISLTGAMQGGATLAYTGADFAIQGSHQEKVGELVVGGNHRSFITLTPGAGDELEIQANNITRVDNGVLLLRGEGLGAAAGTENSTRLTLATAPALVGGILPWAIGDASAAGNGSGFLTYDGDAGLRVLADSDYVEPAGAGTGANVRKSVAGNISLTRDLSVNSWTSTGTGATALGGGTLTIESGAMLFLANATLNGGVIDLASSHQGIIHLAGGAGIAVVINSEITGSQGLIVSGTGTGNKTLTLGGNNSFTGGLRIYTGIVQLTSSGALNGMGVNDVVVQTGGNLRLNGNSAVIASLNGSGNVLNNHEGNGSELAIVSGGTFTGTINDGRGGTLAITSKGGVLVLGGNNNYTGHTRILGGELHVNGVGANPGSVGKLTGTESIHIGRDALFQINNGNATNSQADRVNDAATITMDGGSLVFNHSATGAVAYSETLGAVTFASGANTITTSRASTTGSSTLTITSIDRATGSVINLTGVDIGLTVRNRVDIPTLGEGFVGGWATLGNDFVKYVADIDPVLAGMQGSLTAFVASDYTNTAANDSSTPWTRALHAKPATDQGNAQGLTQAWELASLNLANGIDLNMGTTGSLDIVSGGIIKQGGVAGSAAGQRSQIIGGTLTAGGGAQAAELFVRVTGANLTIGSKIIDPAGDGGVLSLVKSGPGNLILNGANTYSGETWVHSGVLQVGTGGSGTTGYGAVEVATGGALAGSGLVRGDLVVRGGGLQPGDTVTTAGDALGTLSVGADVIFHSGIISLQISEPTLRIPGLADAAAADYDQTLATLAGGTDLNGAVTATQHDRINVTGTFDWGTGEGQVFVLDQGYVPAAGDVFKLFDWSTALHTASHDSGSRFRTGDESGFDLVLPSLGDGLAWDTHLWSSHGILVVTAPEPGRALLLLIGGTTLLMTRRHRRGHRVLA